MSIIGTLVNYTKKIMNTSEQCKGYDFSHILRVYETGKLIGEQEHANMHILEPALILHDVVYPVGKREEHATLSANRAKEILPHFCYNSIEIYQICDAIASHSRSSNISSAPMSLEAKIVYDADKVDGVDEKSIERVKRMFPDIREGAEWYLKRILDVLKNEPPYTKFGKKVMNERLQVPLDWCKEQLGDKDYNTILKEYDMSNLS